MIDETWDSFNIYVEKLEKMVIKIHHGKELSEAEQFNKEEYSDCQQ